VTVTAEHLSVLLVEDAPVNQELAELVFRRAGYEVTAVGTGTAALADLEARSYDVVALDIRLPDMDGREVARQIKGNPRTRDIPVVAITALAMKGDREAALAAGCDAYITKPIDTRTLTQTIEAIIEAVRAKRDGAAEPPPS
jgi:two-component system, cell cycle response regulator DivK